MGFQKKKIPSSYSDAATDEYALGKPQKGKKFMVFVITFILCFGVVLFARGELKPYLSSSMKWVSQGAVTIISNTAGVEPQKDDKGHVNALILGYGGDNHAGGYLTDTIIIASLDPQAGGVTFLSIPRDLYINKTLGGQGKINGDYSSLYYRYEKDMYQAASGFTKKITEITGVPIQYYFMIDFKGFEAFIDKIGGVDIDVPYDIYDTSYPGPNNSYQTFAITQGPQHMTGSVALKYARSRHTTSDFARSMRQQQIIKAVLSKILTFEHIATPGKIKALYVDFESVVHTNMTLDEIIGSMKYAQKIKKFSSFQYAVCSNYRWDLAQPGCLLYYPPLAAFNASVEVPVEASPGNLSAYDALKSFAEQVVYNQGYLVENPAIRILNGVDTGTSTLGNRTIASTTALDFVKMGMRVFDIGNSDIPYEQTTLQINGTGNYDNTIAQMKKIIDIPQVVSGTFTPDGPELTLILGNDYLSVVAQQKPLFLQY